MKIFKTVMLLICTFVLVAGAFSACATQPPVNTTSGVSATESTVSADSTFYFSPSEFDEASYPLLVNKYPDIFSPDIRYLFLKEEELTQQQKKELEALQKKEEKEYTDFFRQRAQIMGLIDDTAERVDPQFIKDLVDAGASFDQIITILDSKYFPDAVGGSGVTLIEYWVDSTGDDYILIIYEQGQIYHKVKNGDTTSTETLYDPWANRQSEEET